MGTLVGRIEKEFMFKTLIEEALPCEIHSRGAEFNCRLTSAGEKELSFAPLDGEFSGLDPGTDVRVFFYLKNNYHTFTTRVVFEEPSALTVEHPKGVYKNLQRKFERIRMEEDIEVFFSLKGKKIELNFPKSERYQQVDPPELSKSFDPSRIDDLVGGFRARVGSMVSSNAITMLRDRLPRGWEEKTIVRLGKSLWIPSTEDDYPQRDPYPDGRVITRDELIRLEGESGSAPHVIASKLGNILYEKSKKEIFSELYCPILYNEYVVGYVHLRNSGEKRERISRDLFDYVYEFSKVLCYSLVRNGYFRAEAAGERKFEAPIIDMSASGLLFAHTSGDLGRELLVHTDLDLGIRIRKRNISIGSRIMRKFKDAESAYFGVLFLKIQPEDFRFLFEYLYGKTYDDKYDMSWEGGAPPPPVEL
jgi:hypothetical protein